MSDFGERLEGAPGETELWQKVAELLYTDAESDTPPGASSHDRPRSYTPEFEIHAAPEAIAAFLDQARERAAAILNEIGWLEALYARRLAGATPSHDRSEESS